MSPKLRYRGDWSAIWEGDCREVAAGIEPGSVSLSIVDGPYFLGLADWDRGKVSDAAGWYAPYLDDVDRVSAASASLYVWGTSELWATLNASIVARGWTFRSLVTWDKGSRSWRASATSTGCGSGTT